MEKSIKIESEKVLEKKLVEEIKKLGGKALKFSSMTDTSYPDRLVMLPGEIVGWVELKSTGKKQTKLQKLRSDELHEMGFDVFVVDSFEYLERVVNYFRSRTTEAMQ